MAVFYGFSFAVKMGDDARVIIYALAMVCRSLVLDPFLFLNYIGIHFHRGGQLMPVAEICRSVFEGQREATTEELKESQQGGGLEIHAFDALTADAKESIISQHLRGDIIAGTSLGMGYCAEQGRIAWNHLTEGKQVAGDAVLEVLKDEHFSPEAVEYRLETMVDSENDDTDAQWGESRFYDFCPVVFHALRHAAGFTVEQYLSSIQGHAEDREKLTSMVEKFSEGRSSSFFYFTHDKRFMVKTVTDDEQETMIAILKRFCTHMANNPDTLINKIFGCHGIRMQGHSHIKMFLVMESVMWTGNLIDYRFDLKGSWVDRLAYKGSKKAILHEEDGVSHVENLMKDTDLKEIGYAVHSSPTALKRTVLTPTPPRCSTLC